MNVPYPESALTQPPPHRMASPQPDNAVERGVQNLIDSGQSELLAAALRFYPHLVDHLDINGRSWMHRAAEVGTWGCAAVLCQAGLPVDFRDIMDETPLHRALLRQRGDVARYLLSAGADPNAASRFGVTPVHLAAAWSNEMLAEVISAGGDVTRRDRYGKGVQEWGAWGAQEAQRQADILADAPAASVAVVSPDDVARLARERRKTINPTQVVFSEDTPSRPAPRGP